MMKIIFQIIAAASGIAAGLLSILLFLRLHWPELVLWFLKLYVSAFSPLLAFIGVTSTMTLSGLAFIYLHGSAWYLLDKDLGTRQFFKQFMYNLKSDEKGNLNFSCHDLNKHDQGTKYGYWYYYT